MSIGVRFYSFSKKENSTKQPSGEGVLMDCVLKDSCSILSPNLIVSTGSAFAPSWNYCFIEAFSRFYFVSNWTWTNGLWSCDCAVDPMASWKSGIGASSQYVTRSASEFDTYIKDDLYPITSKFTREEKNADFMVTNFNQGTFILGLLNDDIEPLKIGSVSYYGLKASDMRVLTMALFRDDFWGQVAEAYSDPLRFIVSCVYIPFNVYDETQKTTLKFGRFNVSYIEAGSNIYAEGYPIQTLTVTHPDVNITLPKHPKADSIGKYLNLSPFSYYSIEGNVTGKIVLDSSILQDITSIDISVNCDVSTGLGSLLVKSNGKIISIDSINLGVPIQLAQSTAFDPSQIARTVASAGGAIGALSVGNIAGAITGGVSAVGSFIDATKENITKSGTNGSFSILVNRPKLIATFYDISDTSNADRGRPLCKERQISTLSGYILCADAHLALPATAEEVANIKNIMEGGFFYE